MSQALRSAQSEARCDDEQATGRWDGDGADGGDTQVEVEGLYGDPAADQRVGTRVGAYEILRVLAIGGMGVVYLGVHVRLGRQVAIKMPRPHVLRDEDLTRRFHSEGTAAVRITHPGVVNVLDYGFAVDGAPYLVMELLEGTSLAERMTTGEPMPLGFTMRLGARVADALAAAHEAGVIHRDLKPENVFLQQHRHRPDRVTVKVLDFGFAKLSGGVYATQAGLILGTPCYMSPEQCLGFVAVDHRSDIYSLGCILYEMVTGQLPVGGTLEEVKVALRYRQILPPGQHNPALPAALEVVIMRMLAKHPNDRPAEMSDVTDALQRILGGRMRHATEPRPEAAASGAEPPISG